MGMVDIEKKMSIFFGVEAGKNVFCGGSSVFSYMYIVNDLSATKLFIIQS